MKWITQHQGSLRGITLVLLLVAMVGPWFFNSDGMPPAEWCHKPDILLENGSCVSLVSGVEIYAFMITGTASLLKQWVTAVVTGKICEFIIVILIDGLLFLLVQPIFSTLLLSYRQNSSRCRKYNRIAWGLAVVGAGLVLAVSSRFSGLGVELWGAWLYIGAGAGMLVVELSLLAARRSSSLG